MGKLDRSYDRFVNSSQKTYPLNFNIKPVVRVEIIKNKSKNWKFYTKGYIKYISDHQKLIDEDDVVDYKSNAPTKNLKAEFGYINYMIRESANKTIEVDGIKKGKVDYENTGIEVYGTNEDDWDKNKNKIWCYDNEYLKDGKVIQGRRSKRARMELKNINDVNDIHSNSHLFSIVISLKDVETEEILWKNQHLIVDQYLRTLVDFPVKAVISFHNNTTHPHIHVLAYQSSNTRQSYIHKKSHINKSQFNLARKSFYHLLFQNQNYFEELINKKHELKMFYQKTQIKDLFLNEIMEILPMFDKFEFNRLDDKQKGLVKDLSKKILELNSVDKDLTEFQQKFKKFDEYFDLCYQKIVLSKNDAEKDSLLERVQRLRDEKDLKFNNQILKTMKEVSISLKTDDVKFNEEYLKNNYKKVKIKITPHTKKQYVARAKPALDNLLGYDLNETNREITKLTREFLREVEQEFRKRKIPSQFW
ncbi:MAG: hypothetical protein ACRCUM_02045 [Mycoplasmoidaceae bacterium]